MNWRIEQQGVGESSVWMVYKGDMRHWATSAEDAVRLMRALEGSEK